MLDPLISKSPLIETKSEEAFYSRRSCPFLTDRPVAIAALYFGLGGYGQWSDCSCLGERDRFCNCRRACGDGMAGNAQLSHWLNRPVNADAVQMANRLHSTGRWDRGCVRKAAQALTVKNGE